MRGLSRVGASEAHRVRRWDVVMLGGALPGLVAAVRLGQRGARVLVVEESSARELPLCLREPFLMTGAGGSGVLGACLRELGLALIDQRRFAVDDVALQLVSPEARVDLGRSARTAAELVAWGLAKPDAARAMLRALEGAAQAEREALLAPTSGRGARLRRKRDAGDLRPAAGARTGPQAAPSFARGWPREAAEADAPLQRIFDAVGRSLAGVGAAPPSPEARALLCGGLLGGASVLGGADGGLLAMLRRRAQALFAEFRSLEGAFELVSVAGQPALSVAHPSEIWAGRVLVLNAPLAGLSRVLGDTAPPLLRAHAARRRVRRHYRGPRQVFPEGMCDRVICLPTAGEDTEPPVVELRRAPGSGSAADHLVASAVAPAEAPEAEVQAWIDRNVYRLLPFSEQQLEPQPLREPLWDTDTLFGAPAGDVATPTATPLSQRPPIHHLDRRSGLGFEGDLLLGWRGADAIAEDLP